MLASQGGLLGLSGVSGDLRDIEQAAAAGNARAQLAWTSSPAARGTTWAPTWSSWAADVIVFTGGIGENRATFRTAVLPRPEELGIRLDPQPTPRPGAKRRSAPGPAGCRFGWCPQTRN